MKSQLFKTAAVIALVLLAAFVWYGVKTDCHNTAIYVRCGGVTL